MIFNNSNLVGSVEFPSIRHKVTYIHRIEPALRFLLKDLEEKQLQIRSNNIQCKEQFLACLLLISSKTFVFLVYQEKS